MAGWAPNCPAEVGEQSTPGQKMGTSYRCIILLSVLLSVRSSYTIQLSRFYIFGYFAAYLEERVGVGVVEDGREHAVYLKTLHAKEAPMANRTEKKFGKGKLQR